MLHRTGRISFLNLLVLVLFNGYLNSIIIDPHIEWDILWMHGIHFVDNNGGIIWDKDGLVNYWFN